MRLLLIAMLLAACTEPRSAMCNEVCAREAKCVKELNSELPFEVSECVAACAALEGDAANNAAKVQRHVDCVHKQTSCAAVLECK